MLCHVQRVVTLSITA